MPRFDADHVINRVDELRKYHQTHFSERSQIRAIMNGGPGALKVLFGGADLDTSYLPVANMMLSAVTRLGQKLAAVPDLRVDPPNNSDSDRARKRAEKKERLCTSWDQQSRLQLQMPQMGRWVPGYGFGVWMVQPRRNVQGDLYPHKVLRDPYNAFPAPWGADQRPADVGFVRRVPVGHLENLYPRFAGIFGKQQMPAPGMFGSSNDSGWEGDGDLIYEWVSADGTYTVHVETSTLIDYMPNMLDRPTFVAPKRFAFDRLTGQYDHIIGLMSMMAKLNILAYISTEDDVFRETNIIGELTSGEYERGRFATNQLMPGSRVDRPVGNYGQQAFTQLNVLERQLRATAGYPVTDDAQSPNSFVTGQGLQELASAVGNEVGEYQTVLKFSLEDLDSVCLEMDEKVNRGKTISMYGLMKGTPFSETYRPDRDIDGDYRTRREYGAMAGFDEAQKIVGMAQLHQMGVIDVESIQDNLSGTIQDAQKTRERIRAEKARSVLYEGFAARAAQGDEQALLAMIRQLPAGKERQDFEDVFFPQGTPDEQVEAAEPEPVGPLDDLAGQGAPPDVTTVMSRLMADGQSMNGLQTVGRVA